MPTMDLIRAVMKTHEPQLLPRTDGLKIAAVAAVVRPGGDDVELLMIHRAEDPRDPWSGHMAFPGGRMENSDRDPLTAAVREAREEVDLDLESKGELLGRLSDVAAVGRGRPMSLVIEPYVFALDQEPALVPNREVAEIVWAPLGYLLDRSNRSTIPWKHGDATVQLPCYRFEGHVIWGLTFGMVDELLTLIDGDSDGRRWMDPR